MRISTKPKIIENVPEDFEVEFDDGTNTIPISVEPPHPIEDGDS